MEITVDFNKKKCCSEYSKLQSGIRNQDSNTLSLVSPKSHVYETRKCDFAVGKVSIMASSVKSRGFPTEMEMELRDIKTRQSRMSSQPSMFRSIDFDGMVKDNGETRDEKGPWRPVRRALGLGWFKQGGTRKSIFGKKL